MQTKEYILTNATQLFNRQGASTSSLRQVAAYLDMSDGNLRYHFKNKEALVTAIFHQLLQELETIAPPAHPDPSRLLADVRQAFRSLYFTMYRYKFLYLEADLLFKQFKGFKKLYGELLEARRAFFVQQLGNYSASGVFNKKHNDLYYERLLEQILIISDNWIRYVEIVNTTPTSIDKQVDHYIDLCLQLLEEA